MENETLEMSHTESELHNQHVSQKRLGKQIMSEKFDPDPPMKVFLKRSMDSYMSIVVIVNLVAIGVMTEYQAAQADYLLGLGDPWIGISDNTFEVAEYIFFTIYLLDLCLRMAILRHEWYFDRIEGWMYLNMFDALLVLINAFELFILPLFIMENQQNATPIRVIKLIRIVRTLRIFKTVSLFRQLRILVGTCIASLGALFWSMVLLMILQIGFALAICQALQLFITDPAANLADRLELREYYGNFLATMYSMFEITFSGSWPTRVRPVTSKVSSWYAVPFLLYITFVVFAVIKIVTALFLKETLNSAANDSEMMMEEMQIDARHYQQKLKDLFDLADDDGNGILTYEEFMHTMTLPSVQQYLKVLDVTVNDCKPLFAILDDGDGYVTITEFCQGLSKLKGHVKPIDFVALQRENSRILKQCQKTSQEVKKASKMVQSLARTLTAFCGASKTGLGEPVVSM